MLKGIWHLELECIYTKYLLSQHISAPFFPARYKRYICETAIIIRRFRQKTGTLFCGMKALSIRFANAKCAMKMDRDYSSCHMDPVTLQELSQPKVSSTEFNLLRSEDSEFWTYDYKVVYDKDGELKLEVCGDEVNIAGRKFSFHKRKLLRRNKTVRPVKSSITFTEDIYFDRIRGASL